MDINITLIGQMITFAVFIWFTMKFVWPPIVKAMHDREKKIADGLAAAEQGKRELELAEHEAAKHIREAKLKAADIVEQANQRATRLIEEGKADARVEGDRLLELAKAEIQQERAQTEQALLAHVSQLALQGAEKVLGQQIDKSIHSQLFDQLIDEI